MKLFLAFVVLCFLGGLVVRPTQSDGPLRWLLAGLCLALVVGFYVLHKV